jgi:hypothetical protein
MKTKIKTQKGKKALQTDTEIFLTCLFKDFKEDICLIDRNYRFLFIKETDEITSNPENVTGKTIFDILAYGYTKKVAEKLDMAFKTEKTVIFEMLYLQGKKFSKYRHFIYPFLISRGRLKAICMISKNINDLSTSERQYDFLAHFTLRQVSSNFNILAILANNIGNYSMQ